MRIFQLALLSFICLAESYGQTATSRYGRIDVEITKEKKPKKIYAKVEIKKAFPGGDSAWVQSFENQINQSLKFRNGAKPGKYIVSVQFVVAKDSSLSDIRSVNDPVGFGMEAVVIRVLIKKTMWSPSSQGVPVKPYRRSAVTYPDSNYYK